MAITVISGGIGSSQTTVAPALPATASAGDLFICHAAEDGAGTFTWASPAVEIKDQAFTGAVNTVAYLIASGGETAMPRITSTVSERWEWNVWRIPAGEWHGTTPPEINTGVTGNNTSPDPGSIAPSWGAENNTVILALCARDDSVANTISAYPSGYTTAQSDKNDITSAANAGGAAQIFASGATSYDPGAFTISATETWIAYAVAIRPAAAGTTVSRTASDSVTYTDTVARIGTFLRSLGDTATYANAVTRTGTFLRTTGDSLGLSAAVARTGTFLRTTADNLGFADSVAALKITLRTAADSLGLTDAIARVLSLGRSPSDTLTAGDSVSRTVTLSRTTGDSVMYGNTVSRVVTSLRTAADNLGASDTVARVVSAIRTAADSISFATTVQRVATTVQRSIDDALAIADSVTRTVSSVRTAGDAVDLANTVVATLGEIIGDAALRFLESMSAALSRAVRFAASLSFAARHEASLVTEAVEYDLSDTTNPTVTFTVDGVATDPTTVTLTVREPDGTSNDYTYGAAQITKSSTGVYTKSIALNKRGVWYFRFVGTGDCAAAVEGTVTVRA